MFKFNPPAVCVATTALSALFRSAWEGKPEQFGRTASLSSLSFSANDIAGKVRKASVRTKVVANRTLRRIEVLLLTATVFPAPGFLLTVH
jgi:hypothetical protein